MSSNKETLEGAVVLTDAGKYIRFQADVVSEHEKAEFYQEMDLLRDMVRKGVDPRVSARFSTIETTNRNLFVSCANSDRVYVVETMQPDREPQITVVEAECWGGGEPQSPSREQDPFAFLSLVVSRRMYLEEVADAQEIVCQLRACGAPKWRIYLKIATTYFWVTLNAIGEIKRRYSGKNAPSDG